jgi:hypothetical protein
MLEPGGYPRRPPGRKPPGRIKNKAFDRFPRKAALGDETLKKAVSDAETGLIDADLGGEVIKQRIARAGGGKSGGFRTIVLFRAGARVLRPWFCEERRTILATTS